MNRRKFIAQAAALNIALAALPTAVAAAARGSRRTPVERVVADSRIAPSVAFAAALAALGSRVSVTAGDLTSLWFDDLARHFAETSAPVAGLTTARTALIMTELARGPGVRVLWRAEHTPLPDGGLRHDCEGAAPLVARAAAVIQTPDWVSGLAAALAGEANAAGFPPPLIRSVWRAPRAAGGVDETLSSWVLAPRHATTTASPDAAASYPEDER